MGIIIKHTFQNISSKPFRSCILIFCVTITCLTAFFLVDLSSSISDIYAAHYVALVGNADIQLESSHAVDTAIFETLPDCDYISIAQTSNRIATRDPRHYSYEFIHPLEIIGINTEKAYAMRVFQEEFTLNDQETAVSRAYADTFDIHPGDTIQLLDEAGTEHSFTVKTILEKTGLFIRDRRLTAVVNENAIKVLKCTDDLAASTFLIDVADDSLVNEFCYLYKEADPSANLMKTKGEDSGENANQFVTVFAVLFVITFLMVIFVTVSMSEKIVDERMAVIGTFRSLGISRKLTTAILLAENVCYGLIGYLIAFAIYGLSRKLIFTGLFSMMLDTQVDVKPIPLWIPPVVLIGAVLVECFTPLMGLAKAVKVSIRDIIFTNKDTDYVISRSRTIAGVVLLVLGAAASWIDNAIVLIVGIVVFVIGAALVTPLFISKLSLALKALFGKLRLTIAEMASIEVGTKKSTVSNSILCLTVSALAIAMLSTANGVLAFSENPTFDADIIGEMSDRGTDNYSYIADIDGVEKVFFLNQVNDNIEINGEFQKGFVKVFGMPDKDIFFAFPNLPDTLAEDECVLSLRYAKMQGIKEGDTVAITFKSEGMFPITRNMRVVRTTDTSRYDSGNILIINNDLYSNLYHSEWNGVYIRCQDAEIVREEILKHSLDQSLPIFTRDEWLARMAGTRDRTNAAVSLAICFGLLLSIIGLSGNQVLGFEARRREYAVLYSTCMSRKQITQLIFMEALLSIGISVFTGTIVGLFVSRMVQHVTEAMAAPLPVGIKFGQYLLMIVGLTAVMVIASLKPMRLLKKMQIAAELKYE